MSDDAKIIIDEDWKSQVQREKEQAVQQPEEAPVESAEESQEGMLQASFDSLVSSLATQTLFALGAIAPQGGEQQVMVDLDQAQFTIKMLDVLKEKTAGNLSEEEEGHLTEALAELQRLYLVRVQQFQEASMQNAGLDLDNIRTQQ